MSTILLPKWCVLLAVTLLSSLAATPAPVPAFKAGDRVVHIGDSITHGGSYHSNVYLFYLTRFPQQSFQVWNCGISGDTAPGTNQRFDWDIAVHRPNRATIMLGMNDAWAWLFNSDASLVSREQGKDTARKLYREEMSQLLDSLQQLDCEITLIRPSIYDQTVVNPTNNLVGKNDLLGEFAGYVDQLALEYDASVIDFYDSMGDLNASLQATDPSATVVGLDRVHPGAAGHLVMSYQFLKSMEMPQLVSLISLDADSGEIVELDNVQLRKGGKIEKDRIEFVCLEGALPFPLTDAAGSGRAMGSVSAGLQSTDDHHCEFARRSVRAAH